MTSQLTDVNTQWSTRPADERFTSLAALRASVAHRAEITIEPTVAVSDLQVVSSTDQMLTGSEGGGLLLRGKATAKPGQERGLVALSHWSFGQLAGIAGAPAGYLRQKSAPMVALNMNEDLARRGHLAFSESGRTKMLVQPPNGAPGQVLAFTSEGYGRIRDVEVVDAVVGALNDLDRAGSWGIPGTFGGNSGRQYEPYDGTGHQTTLYSGDHDVYVFQADESRLMSVDSGAVGDGGVPARPMSRGFIVWNSETGAKSFGLKFFTFDYVCANRIIWDASILGELRIRHTSGAPRRFMADAVPAIRAFVEGSDAPMLARIARAGSTLVGDGKPATLAAWLQSQGLTRTVATGAVALASVESAGGSGQGSVWDLAQGVTAFARGVQYADERVDLESVAGRLLTDAGLASAARFERSTRDERMVAA